MTNEEKAMEISSHRTSLDYEIMAYDGALEMAEWKDHQFREYLEKKRSFYYKEAHKNNNSKYLYDFAECVDTIINELFGGE